MKGKAKAVKVSDKEAMAEKELLTKNKEIFEQSKLPNKLNDQKDYRAMFLDLMLKKTELEEMEKQIKLGQDNKPLEIQWSGMPCPLQIAICNFNILFHNYKMTLTAFTKLESKLKDEHKYSEEQLKDVRENGNFIKE